MVMPDIAKMLNRAGYVALLFDYRGFGDSEGPRWRLVPYEQVNDIRAALTFAAAQPQVDPERLAILGISLGGSHAVTVGALDRRVKAVIAIEPPGNGERWLRSLRRYSEWLDFQARLVKDRLQRVRTGSSERVDPLEIVVPDPGSQAFLEVIAKEFPQMKCDLPLETADALIEYNPEAMVDRIAPRPVLFIHGDHDRLVPVNESRSMFEQAGEPRQLEVIPGMDHFDWVMPDSPGFGQVANLVKAFLHEFLPVQ
jgi:pimeloyl-ACP methyl ester carboxylesterase